MITHITYNTKAVPEILTELILGIMEVAPIKSITELFYSMYKI